jgi:hypothetical protein
MEEDKKDLNVNINEIKSNLDKKPKVKPIPKWLALFFFWFIILSFFGIIFSAIYRRDVEKHNQRKTIDHFINEASSKKTKKDTAEMIKHFIETDPQLQKELKNKADIIAEKEIKEKWRNVSLEEIFKSDIQFLNVTKELLNTKIDVSNKPYLQEGLRFCIEIVSGLINSQKSTVPRSLEIFLQKLNAKEQEVISYKNEN